uniref:Uncharacterized protein n=1 Tax=Pogona vitticeps TaxID=103695 RepID=A0ABM5ESD0_9SAUR
MTNALVQGRKKCRPGHEQAGETRANEMLLLLLLEGPRGLKTSLLQSCSLGEEGKHCYCKSEECVALQKSLDYSAHHPWPLGFLANCSLRIALALAKQNSRRHGEKSLHGDPHSLPIFFDAAVLKLLLVASMIIMLLPERPGTHGAPAKKCFHMKTPEHNGAAFRNLRNKYENLRFREVAPWWNCSGEHLRLPKLKALTKWEMLEAVESQLDLFIPVLQNQSEASFSQDASQVLDFLLPFRGELKACIQHMPAHPPKSGHLQEFKAQLQTFNTSNVEQSPKCLEAAVGLNIYRLLSDLTHHILHQDYRYHHRQHHRRHPSSN